MLLVLLLSVDNFGNNFVDILWIMWITPFFIARLCGYVDNIFHNVDKFLACLDACVDNFGNNFVDILWIMWITPFFIARSCGYVDNIFGFVDNFCWSYG